MTRVLAMLLLGLCLAAPARAQDAETMRAAQNLASLVGGDSMQQVSGALINQIWGGLEAKLSGKVYAATLSELRGELERLLTKFMTDVMKDAPALYARHFTAAEMNDMIAFYKTPTGIKTLREMPKVSAEIFAMIAPRMAPFQQDVTATTVAVLKKHGYNN